MGTAVSYFNGSVFDPQATRAMGEAFDLACQTMRIGAQSEVVKEIMAARIIQAAKSGEFDPHRLAAKAMDAIGVHLP
jgi:hypothetical protein